MFTLTLLASFLCALQVEFRNCVFIRSPEYMHNITKRQLNLRGCGEKDGEFSPRIVSGAHASTLWSWMADIRSDTGLCGGSVIDKTHIITAAHCIDDLNPQAYTVRVGSMYRGQGTAYAVQEIRVHEGYNEDSMDNDIAMLTLREALADSVVPVCLPEDDSIETGVTIIGFGDGTPYGLQSNSLQEISDILYVDPDNCALIIKPISRMKVTEKQLCTNAFLGGKGACLGDSGGPVMLRNPDDTWTLVGLVSYTLSECASPGSTTVHTRMYAYRDWIQKKHGFD